ncbi:hypothetical protein BC829DRAFT_492939 [Chytridium lagenaria]|nr:hypothetical protein BC829DRAFT_492939 [Chytridium lagenaria]
MLPRFLLLLLVLLPFTHADSIRITARQIDSTHVRFHLSSSLPNIGWMALGFGDKMEGSDIIVVWRADSGIPIVSHRKGGVGYVEPVYVKESRLVAVVPEEEGEGEGYRVSFEVYTPALARPFTNEEQPFLWAYGITKPASSPDATLAPHSPYGKGIFRASLQMISTGRGPAAGAAGVDGAGVTRDPFAATRTVDAGAVVTNVEGTVTGASVVKPTVSGVLAGAGQGEEGEGYSVVIKVHAVLMFIAWGILAPISVFLARYYKGGKHDFIPLHSTIMLLGTVLLTVVAFILVMAVSKNGHFNVAEKGAHGVIGLMVFLGVLVQPILAVVHRSYKTRNYSLKARARTLTENIHRWLGRGIVLLALINLALGLGLYNRRAEAVQSSTWTCFVLWIMLLAALFAFSEGRVVGAASHVPLVADAPYIKTGKEDSVWIDDMHKPVNLVASTAHSWTRRGSDGRGSWEDLRGNSMSTESTAVSIATANAVGRKNSRFSGGSVGGGGVVGGWAAGNTGALPESERAGSVRLSANSFVTGCADAADADADATAGLCAAGEADAAEGAYAVAADSCFGGRGTGEDGIWEEERVRDDWSLNRKQEKRKKSGRKTRSYDRRSDVSVTRAL